MLRMRVPERIWRMLEAAMPAGSQPQWIRETKWKALLYRVEEAVKLREFDKIEDLLGKAEEELIQLDLTASGRVLKLNELGDLYQALAGNNTRAQRLYQEAIDWSERYLSTGDPAHILSLNNLGYMLLHHRRFDEAELLFERLLPLVETSYGPNDLELAACLENLAVAYRQNGKDARAIEVRAWAGRIRRQKTLAG